MEKRNIKLKDLEVNKGQIFGLPKNPRFIRDHRFAALKKSIEDAPEMLAYRTLLVYPNNGKFVIICGNMRFRACKDLGYAELPCTILPEDTPVAKLREYTIKDNISFGADDMDALANEWESEELTDWGMEIAGYGETEDEILERKKKEFEERMAGGECLTEDEEYNEFLAKFEAKKTTDDCYTPECIYEAVAAWVANEYKLSRSNFVRPFYPNGDYKREEYKPTDVVVDNPPFSILSEIVKYYTERGIRFFLFAPHLTLFSAYQKTTNYIVCGCPITYENGANVNTSFVTTLDGPCVAFRSSPSLYAAVNAANEENLRAQHKELPKYSYPKEVIMTPNVHKFSRYGIDFVVNKNECALVNALDEQKEKGKAIFGKGFLLSERLVAERLVAERLVAEREERERLVAERWSLSERERAIVKSLGKGKTNT